MQQLYNLLEQESPLFSSLHLRRANIDRSKIVEFESDFSLKFSRALYFFLDLFPCSIE